jgi:hypothetical protein
MALSATPAEGPKEFLAQQICRATGGHAGGHAGATREAMREATREATREAMGGHAGVLSVSADPKTKVVGRPRGRPQGASSHALILAARHNLILCQRRQGP